MNANQLVDNKLLPILCWRLAKMQWDPLVISRWPSVMFGDIMMLHCEFHFTQKLILLLLPGETSLCLTVCSDRLHFLPRDIRGWIVLSADDNVIYWALAKKKGCISDPSMCVCVCAAAFSRIQARLLLAVDRTERLRCMKRDSFIPSCLSEPEEEAVLEKPEPQALGWVRASRNCLA